LNNTDKYKSVALSIL